MLVPYTPPSAYPPAALALLGGGLVLLLVLAPFLSRFLCHLLKREKPNFRGDVIPASVGLTFLLVAVVVYGGLAASGATLGQFATLFLFVSVGFGLLGLMDDLWGNRAVGGFRGHLRALFRGRPTTGAIKLLGGGLVALGASILRHQFHDPLLILLDALVIALAANTLNLLDVRPGRAQFGFLLFVLPIFGATLALGRDWIVSHPPPSVLLGPVALAALTEWWPDCRGRAMMGDVGANLLGAVAGLSAAFIFPLWGRLLTLALLIGINLLAERVSLSRLIADTPPLAWLDRQLGVRDSAQPRLK